MAHTHTHTQRRTHEHEQMPECDDARDAKQLHSTRDECACPADQVIECRVKGRDERVHFTCGGPNSETPQYIFPPDSVTKQTSS